MMLEYINQKNPALNSEHQIEEVHALVQEDETSQIKSTLARLKLELSDIFINLKIDYADSSDLAEELIKKKKYNILWSDARMPKVAGKSEYESEHEYAGVEVLRHLYSGALGDLNIETKSIIVSNHDDVDTSSIKDYKPYLYKINKGKKNDVIELFKNTIVNDRIKQDKSIVVNEYDGYELEISQTRYPLNIFLTKNKSALETYNQFDICSDITLFSLTLTKEVTPEELINVLDQKGNSLNIQSFIDSKYSKDISIICVFESGEFRTMHCQISMETNYINIIFQNLIELLDPIDSEYVEMNEAGKIEKYNSKGLLFAVSDN